MPFVDGNQLIKAFLWDGANPASRISIGIRSTNRCANHLDVLCSKDLIKGCGELGVPIMEQVLKSWWLVFKRPAQLAGLLSNPTGGWMFSTASNVNTVSRVPCKNSSLTEIDNQ